MADIWVLMYQIGDRSAKGIPLRAYGSKKRAEEDMTLLVDSDGITIPSHEIYIMPIQFIGDGVASDNPSNNSRCSHFLNTP